MNDAVLIQRAFSHAKVVNPVVRVGTGEEGLAYLKGTGVYANRELYPMPGLVLLDLKLPGMDGLEVLKTIKETPELAGLRVVVLTGSTQALDGVKAYQLGADWCLLKPLHFERFADISSAMSGCWVWSSEAESLTGAKAAAKTMPQAATQVAAQAAVQAAAQAAPQAGAQPAG